MATRVDLGGTLVTGGDGLLVRGNTLYVVQGGLNQVSVITLDADGTSGTLVDTLTSAISTCRRRSLHSATACTCPTPGSTRRSRTRLTGSRASTAAEPGERAGILSGERAAA